MRTNLCLAAVGIMTIGLGACSSSSKKAAPSTSTLTSGPTTSGPTTAVDDLDALAPFLLASGEEPGYEPVGEVTTDTNAAAVAGDDNLDASVLTDAKFVGLASRRLEGAKGAGVTSVVLFETAAGAGSYLHALDSGLEKNLASAKPKRFDVSSVPGSLAYTATFDDRHVGNVVWAEGTCVLTVGNESDGALEKSLTTGAEQWHERIAGVCPLPKQDAYAAKEVWQRPAKATELARQAGLAMAHREELTFHRHSHLDVFVDGKLILVPGGIGIEIDDPGVKAFPLTNGHFAYGGIEQPCDKPCISPLHTHEPDGMLHTESSTGVPHKLGQFFVEWGVKLTTTCVGQYCSPEKPIAFYVNGTKFAGDPRSIVLEDGTEIALVIGVAPTPIPSEFVGGG